MAYLRPSRNVAAQYVSRQAEKPIGRAKPAAFGLAAPSAPKPLQMALETPRTGFAGRQWQREHRCLQCGGAGSAMRRAGASGAGLGPGRYGAFRFRADRVRETRSSALVSRPIRICHATCLPTVGKRFRSSVIHRQDASPRVVVPMCFGLLTLKRMVMISDHACLM